MIRQAQELWTDLYNAVVGDDPDLLDVFCTKHANSIAPGFVDRILRDAECIKNAIITGINSGFVEGGNNRFKVVKRVFFGRAGADLLLHTCYGQFVLRHGLATMDELLPALSAAASAA